MEVTAFHVHPAGFPLWGLLVSVALFLALRRPAVSRHPALWSPDFPLRADCAQRLSGQPHAYYKVVLLPILANKNTREPYSGSVNRSDPGTPRKEARIMERPTRLLDPRFKYVPARETDIAKTFARIRREQAKARALGRAAVIPINKERGLA